MPKLKDDLTQFGKNYRVKPTYGARATKYLRMSGTTVLLEVQATTPQEANSEIAGFMSDELDHAVSVQGGLGDKEKVVYVSTR